MGERRRGGRVGPTDEWEQIELLCAWPERERYEQIRPLVLFDAPVAARAAEVDVSESTLYRRLGPFEAEGMESLLIWDESEHQEGFQHADEFCEVPGIKFPFLAPVLC